MSKARDELKRRVQMAYRQIDMMAEAMDDQWAALRFVAHFCPDQESMFGDDVPSVVKEGVSAIMNLVEGQTLLIRNDVIPELEAGVENLADVVKLELERLERARRPRPVE